MTTSSSENDTGSSQTKRRRREERLDRFLREAEDLLEQMRRNQIRREVLEELDERRQFGLFRRY